MVKYTAHDSNYKCSTHFGLKISSCSSIGRAKLWSSFCYKFKSYCGQSYPNYNLNNLSDGMVDITSLKLVG